MVKEIILRVLAISLFIQIAVPVNIKAADAVPTPTPPPTKSYDQLSLDEKLGVDADQAGDRDFSNVVDIQNPDRNLAQDVCLAFLSSSGYATNQFERMALDGDLSTHWRLPSDHTEGWIQFPLGALTTFNKMVLVENGNSITSYTVEYYDGLEWKTLTQGTKIPAQPQFFDPVKAGTVRISIKTTGGGGFKSIELYNTTGVPDGIPGSMLQQVYSAVGECIVLRTGSPAALSYGKKTVIDKRNQSLTPVLADSDILVPVKFVAEGFGLRVSKKASTLSIVTDGRNITIDTDKQTLTIDGNESEVLPVMAEQTAMLPVKALAEILGKSVFIDDKGLVIISAQQKKFDDQNMLDLLAEILAPELAGFTKIGQRDAYITPTNEVQGKTMEYVATRTNDELNVTPYHSTAAWLRYTGFNGARSWKRASSLSYSAIYRGQKTIVRNLTSFDKAKDEFRKDPVKNIEWDNVRYSADPMLYADYEYDLYKSLGITPINQTGIGNWGVGWSTTWENWVKLYAMAFHLAKEYGVDIHQYGNEPEFWFNRGDNTIDDYLFFLQINSDAMMCAIEDVNRIYGKQLDYKYVAPVLASSGVSNLARTMMRNIRTDYRGNQVDYDIVHIYDKHRYGDRPLVTSFELSQIQDMMVEESPLKEEIPVMYSEFNYSTGGNWRNRTYTSDDPLVFRSVAGTWAFMMEQGVWAMYLFKLADERIKNGNNVAFMFEKEVDPEYKTGQKIDIGYVTKNLEVARLFAEGYKNSVDLFKTESTSADINYKAFTSYQPEMNNYYMYMVQTNDIYDYNVTLDLSELDVAPGNMLTVKEVSTKYFGEMVYNVEIPESKKINLTQPKESVWLVSFPKGELLTYQNLLPVADAEVIQGSSSSKNFGKNSFMEVRRGETSDDNHISYLKFNAGDMKLSDTNKAILNLYGKQTAQNAPPEGSVIRVYGIADDQWSEGRINAKNAPNIHRTVSTANQLDIDNSPVGHMTFFGSASYSSIDVTDFVKRHKDQDLTFILIREMKWPGDVSTNEGVTLATKESSQAPYLELWQ